MIKVGDIVRTFDPGDWRVVYVDTLAKKVHVVKEPPPFSGQRVETFIPYIYDMKDVRRVR